MLKIIIEGGEGEGKTTLLCEIEALCETLGMRVQVYDRDPPHETDVIHEAKKAAMKGRDIMIETKEQQVVGPARPLKI